MSVRADRGRASHRRGLIAESKCVWYLRLKGYRIVDRRFKTPVGEIDIVAARGDTLAFIEVKARPTYDSAALAITPRTMARMQRAAEYFLVTYRNQPPSNLRLDVMFVTPFSIWPAHLTDNLGSGGR
jgi:putative endonuclease